VLQSTLRNGEAVRGTDANGLALLCVHRHEIAGMERTTVRDGEQECLRALGVLNDDNVARDLILHIQFNAAMDAAVQFDGTLRAKCVCRCVGTDNELAAFETMAFRKCVKNDAIEAFGAMLVCQP
jgi:hypothetical protein